MVSVEKYKETKYSALNLIEGIGPVMKRRLIKKYKNIKNIKNASSKDLMLVKGVNKKLCERIQQGLK